MKNIENKVKYYSNDDLLVTYDKEYLKFSAEQDKKEAEEKGEIKGKLQEEKEIAKSMLKDGMPIKDIMKYTGFSESEIKEL